MIYQVKIPFLGGTFESLLKDIYLYGEIKAISNPTPNLQGIKTILNDGLKAIKKQEMIETLKSIQGIILLVMGLIPTNIQPIISSLFLEPTVTASALYELAHTPIGNVPAVDLKFISTLVGKIMNIDLNEDFLPEVIKLLNSGVPVDEEDRKHMAKVISKDLPKLLGSQEDLKLIEYLIAGQT